MLHLSKFFPSNVVAFTSDRSVDFSLEKSIPFSSEQKQYLESKAVSNPQQVFNIRQVHGSTVITASSKDLPQNKIPEADASLTNALGLAISVRTADCLPIFLYDPQHDAVGLIHAGWRGSQKTIAAHVIKRMNDLWLTQTPELKVAFGPGIRECCYQVGEEFRQYFPREITKRPTGFYLDLVKVNISQMLSLGLKKENIHDCGACTCCDKHSFSYRREKEKAGRMISVMMLKF